MLGLVGLAAGPLVAAGLPAIVPNPASVERRTGEFAIDASTAVVASSAAAHAAAERLASLVARFDGVKLEVRDGSERDGAVNVKLDADAKLGAEGYRIDVAPERVTIVASTPIGLSHAATTAAQLVVGDAGHRSIPSLAIADAPRFAWRGVLLDSARHFQSVAFIHRFLEAMALTKLNVLHWHLTDDQAWRLEIRKYPRLTEVGAWRVPAGAAKLDIDPLTGAPRAYGGFYTQAEAREIVAHAAALGITVVPEIEMPGHATAAIVAYPKLAAVSPAPTKVPSDWGIYPNAYSLEDSTFAFLEDVLGEVLAVFPGKYIHVGGDEVDKAQWRESARGQALACEAKRDDPEVLQAYFTQRIARYLESRGRRLVGWDEILQPGLPSGAVVMSWRGIDGAVKAATAGNDAVLSPWPTLYFDNRNAPGAAEPPGRVRVISLEDVYRFEPMPAAISAESRRHILGIQGNVWTEHIRTEERVGWMTFPRAAAVAELGWSQPSRRDWDDFRARAAALAARYDALGMTYAKSAFVPPPAPSTGRVRTSHDLKLCSDDIAIALEDDAPPRGPRAVFAVDIQNPCWIYTGADLSRVSAIDASVGQVPFNFQIGDAVKKIAFPKPQTRDGELEVRVDSCDGDVLARLPLAPAAASSTVTRLPRAAIAPRPGRHDLCLRFAQPSLEPMWVIDSVGLVESAP